MFKRLVTQNKPHTATKTFLQSNTHQIKKTSNSKAFSYVPLISEVNISNKKKQSQQMQLQNQSMQLHRTLETQSSLYYRKAK